MSTSTSQPKDQPKDDTPESPEVSPEPKPKRFTISLSSFILFSLFAGIATGLFFGEEVAWMGGIGKAVILLMQMTIFPYILVSLISGIGQLNADTARKLFTKGGIVLVAIWLFGLVFIIFIASGFPDLESGSFFSTSIVTPKPPVDYFSLYVPSNPFSSMANGEVPAIVVFSIALGVAVITLTEKKAFLDVLNTTSQGLSKITQSLVKILPVGIFSISASAAGTISIDEFNSLQIFLIAYFGLCLFFTFIALPLLVSTLTPFTYGQVISISRDSLVTAFSTGNIFIVLPVLIEGCKKLFKQHAPDNEHTDYEVDVLLPVAFTFPNLGKVTLISFILFAGWFIGKPIDWSEKINLAFSGLLSMFGSVYVAIPFMLDNMRLPTDLYELFMVSSFITGKFNSMVAVMHLVVFTLLSVCALQGFLKINMKRVTINIAVMLISFLIILVSCRLIGNWLLEGGQDTTALVKDMNLEQKDNKDVRAQVQISTPEGYKAGNFATTTVNAIKDRGVIRVGYTVNNVPFSFFNRENKLVGFDVELAYQLADDLGVVVEFIPFRIDDLEFALNRGHFDIAMSGIEMTEDHIQTVLFTDPVLTLNLSIVTKDFRMKEFDTIPDIQNHEAFTMAIVEENFISKFIRKNFDNIELITIPDYGEFFNDLEQSYDTLLISAEAGYAWTLSYPEYGVVLPQTRPVRFPVAYVVNRRNKDLHAYLNNWLAVKKSQDKVDQVYEYWILGKGAQSTEARWSVKKDILGW